jgi:hypothetical protein
MNAALAFLNGVGRDRPEASDAAARCCEKRAQLVSTVSHANGLVGVKK